MSESESTNSPQVKLMHGWGQGFKKRDLDLIAKCLHKDYRHTTYPRSLNKPEQTREEWLQQFAGIISLWTDLEPTIHSIIDAQEKVIVHITNKAKTLIGVDMNRESIFIGHIVTDEDGSLKIRQIEEFTDSKAHLDFTQAVAAVTAKKH